MSIVLALWSEKRLSKKIDISTRKHLTNTTSPKYLSML